SGRAATRSSSTPSHRAPRSSKAAAILAATWLLASSAISATCSLGSMARQTSTAFRAPPSRSGDAGPNSDRLIRTILLGPYGSYGSERTYDERRNLSTARRHVGEAGRAQTRQKSREASTKDIGCEIDEHVARTRTTRRAAVAHRKPLAADRDAFLCHPAAIAFGERPRNRGVPVRFLGSPPQRDSSAAVFVVRLDHEPVAR